MVIRLPFFFSSRRRHTRCLSDWSSDVCSSDLRTWPSAVSRTSTTLRPVSINAGMSPFKKSTTILPVGVGFTSWSTTGAVGFTITTGYPSREFKRHLLGHELGALVVPGHIADRYRRLLIADAARRDSDTADRA